MILPRPVKANVCFIVIGGKVLGGLSPAGLARRLAVMFLC